MQTILGANGQIGYELAVHLHRNFTHDIRLVSRRPQKIHETDQILSADLLDAEQTQRAVSGSEIVYLTAGLPMDTSLWVAQWPLMMHNVLEACAVHQAKLVFFDNTYMYPQTAEPQTENTPFVPYGAKGKVRAQIAQELLNAMQQQRVQAMICRAPEFYGPAKTQSITNSTLIEPLKAGKSAKVLLRDDTRRSLIYTPDASHAMALLANTPDAYGQTWHLPIDDNRLTYQELIALAADIFQVEASYKVIKAWQFKLASLVKPELRDAAELLPRYQADNLFVVDKFKTRFPDFKVTTLREGLTAIKAQ